MPLSRTQKALANSLLQTASERLKSVSGDVPSFNLISVLQMEHLETQTHSKIIFYLLNDRSDQNNPYSFLQLFLRVLNVPKKFLGETWNVYRERAFDSGASRIDFVLESESCCVMIEMKIDAGDGESQLIRYEAYGRKKGKEYIIYYLTPDGHRPEEQSAKGIDANKLRCISFEKEIIVWLQECMKCVENCGYKYSFLKQYLGAVRQITDTNDEEINVKDLLNSSDMVKAAQLVADSFYEKMDDITAQFFHELDIRVRRKIKLKTKRFTNALDVYLKEFTYRKHSYVVILFVDFDPCLETGIAFSEVMDEDTQLLRLDEAEKRFPSIYRAWIDKLESLEGIPKFKRWSHSRYFLLEDSRGSQLNFRDYSAQIELIDEMKPQCQYICDTIVNLCTALTGGMDCGAN